MKAETKETIGDVVFWLFVAIASILVYTFGLNK